MNDYLMHIGTPHEGTTPHSGRYPYGSGENPYQRYGDFYFKYKNLEAQGLSQKEIAEQLGVVDRFGKPNVRQLRARYSNARAEKRAADRDMVFRLKEEGKNRSEIARIMGMNESTIRSLEDESKAARMNLNQQTAELLKAYVDENRYVDISSGTNIYLGVTKNRLDNAVALLQEDGYKQQLVKIDQMGTDHKTTFNVLTAPDVDYAELQEHKFDIVFPGQENRTTDVDGNVTRLGLTEPPNSIDSSRIMVMYAEDGGKAKDGLIELRPGVDDISIGNSLYAQIRMGVDDTHYLKGMAVYNPNMPPGVDVIFNTNKHVGTPLLSSDPDAKQVLKPMKTNKDGSVDWDNPFGAVVSQLEYTDKNGERHTSAANIVRLEGEWLKWTKSLSSQFLSKQNVSMAERQLNLALADKRQEYEEICSLTNPVVKKKLLETFADKCDTLAVDLQAAPFAGQNTHVILPFPTLKDGEIYAPNYRDGTRVALVRYPHGGTFEIPLLTVKNKGSVARDIIGDAPDAVGINSHVAERLSGADFDGDTVVVIPLSDKANVRSKPPLAGLEGFDAKEQYPGYKGMKVLSKEATQIEMGKITNLIADMTLKGANEDDLAAAVRHSQVIIDAHKHKLNYKQSEIDNEISKLKHRYQDTGDGHTGAGTIISRAGSPYSVFARKDYRLTEKSVDAEGNKIHTETEEWYTKGKLKNVTIKNGGEVSVNIEKSTGRMYYLKDDPDTHKKVRVYATPDDFSRLTPMRRMQDSTKMAETKDAYTLTSGGSKENYGYPMEKVYAEFANGMKSLGRSARLEYLRTPNQERDPESAKKYKAEVDSLNKKLENAKANAPLERQAQLIANRTVALKKEDNPLLDKDDIKKIKGQAINAARLQVGAGKKQIEITDKEWEAIQNKAISHSRLTEIINNSDLDILREKATPRNTKSVTPAMEALARSMKNSGYTSQQIADRLGVSTSTLYKALKSNG